MEDVILKRDQNLLNRLKKENLTKNEIWLINRWENWNKIALINTRKAIKKANADLKLLNLEKDLIHNIKKKWKS